MQITAFLSTLSLRRATIGAHSPLEDLCYFYPRSPCGERPDLFAISARARLISIHALLAESDSVPTARWRTYAISIHALLAESDRSAC